MGYSRFLAGVTRLDGYIEVRKEHIGKVIECSEYSLISLCLAVGYTQRS